MSEENSTHFQFRLGGIELEISGDREFVEQMYARVMRDIESVRKRIHGGAPGEARPVTAPDEVRERQILWVHRCSPMMHKIYMSSPAELDKSALLCNIETSQIDICFADRDVFERILPGGGKGNTLWAELTERGRQKIAGAVSE